jgi:hypothetical protein
MPTCGRVPFAGLYVFPLWTFLQEELPLAVEQVQVHHGMQYLGAVMGLSATDAPYHTAVLINHRE